MEILFYFWKRKKKNEENSKSGFGKYIFSQIVSKTFPENKSLKMLKLLYSHFQYYKQFDRWKLLKYYHVHWFYFSNWEHFATKYTLWFPARLHSNHFFLSHYNHVAHPCKIKPLAPSFPAFLFFSTIFFFFYYRGTFHGQTLRTLHEDPNLGVLTVPPYFFLPLPMHFKCLEFWIPFLHPLHFGFCL